MSDYYINVNYSAEKKTFIADLPDLPECRATAATPEEAVREALVNKKLWLAAAKGDGIPIPQPVYKPQQLILPLLEA